MKLNRNFVTDTKEITTLTDWKILAPPMGGDKHWRDGRSAKELARYITESLPQMPKELEQLLSGFSGADSAFNWSAEYVTDFQKQGYGRGNGRNHDLILYNDDVFVGIEAKADEPFGKKTIAQELVKAADNKKLRIDKLVSLVFGDETKNHLMLHYQLLTACGGVLLEAKQRKLRNAVMLVLVFLKKGIGDDGKPYYHEENRMRNNSDWEEFLCQLQAVQTDKGCYKATAAGAYKDIDLYLHKIEIPLD